MNRRFAYPLVLALATLAPAAFAAPAPAPVPPPLRFPAPEQRTLANGLRVVVFPSASLPIVQAQLLVPAGSAEEPDSLPGLAVLTARIVPLGSASRTGEQLAADLDALGATLISSAGRDYALATCGSRSSAFEALLEILGDVVVHPRLGDDEFELARRAAVQQLRTKSQSEALLADDRTWGVAFDPHPYGHPEAGDIDALIATRLEHVRAFVRDRWRPDRAVLAIAGDVSPERAFAVADSAFGRWGGSTSADRVRPAPVIRTGVSLLDLPGSPRAEVRVAVRGPGRASAGLGAWQVAAAVLEDRLAGTNAAVTLTPLREASLLVLSEGGSADSARAIARRLLGALRTFASAPPAGGASVAVSRRIALALPLSLETLGARMSRWQADDLAGLPADGLSRALASPAAAPDLAAVAQSLAAPPSVLVAGSADQLRKQLAPLGEVTVVPLAVRRSSRPDTLAIPTESELRAGRVAIAAAVAAHGGAAKLAAAKIVVAEGEMGLDSGGQTLEGQFSLIRIDPARLSYSTKLMSFEVRQVLDGAKAWTLAQADSASLSDADSTGVSGLQAMLNGDLVHMLRAASNPASLAAQRGRETIAGKACELVDFTGLGGERFRLAIDGVTRRVIAVDAQLGADIRWHDRRLFSDFRTVAGLLLPWYEERFVDGERVTYFRNRGMTVNPVLDERLFRKPRVVRGQILQGN
jgi:zinc protease